MKKMYIVTTKKGNVIRDEGKNYKTCSGFSYWTFSNGVSVSIHHYIFIINGKVSEDITVSPAWGFYGVDFETVRDTLRYTADRLKAYAKIHGRAWYDPLNVTIDI